MDMLRSIFNACVIAYIRTDEWNRGNEMKEDKNNLGNKKKTGSARFENLK